MSKQTQKGQAQQQTLPFSGWETSNMASEPSPLQLESITTAMAKHTSTVSEMEMALSTHSLG